MAADILDNHGPPPLRVLDPMAGVGGIFDLPNRHTIMAVELEPEWAAAHPGIHIGDASDLPVNDAQFDAVVTSPPYGNRMADKLLIDGYKRVTYANMLGRDLSPGSAAAMQWGRNYRFAMTRIWRECYRVTRPGGLLILFVRDHVRDGRWAGVPVWHVKTLANIGYRLTGLAAVKTPGMGYGANTAARVGDGELCVVMERD